LSSIMMSRTSLMGRLRKRAALGGKDSLHTQSSSCFTALYSTRFNVK
jgi:hypothetical protein